MKEFILLNYNLKVERIYKNIFFIEDYKIKIIRLKNISNIGLLAKLTNEMYSKKIMVNTFILNINNEFYTKRNKDYIVLLRINENDEYFGIEEILKYSENCNQLDKYNIVEEYKRIIDDFENKISKYSEEVYKTANYYIGMGENAISILNEHNDESNNLGHKINIYKLSKKELNNPFNFVKINKYYNISNYLKYKFINNKFDYQELDNVLESIDTEEDGILFFAYMLFPNYYFDIFDEEIDMRKVKIIEKNSDVYMKILKYTIKKVKKNKKIKIFVWIN